jgi:hypothetical protein
MISILVVQMYPIEMCKYIQNDFISEHSVTMVIQLVIMNFVTEFKKIIQLKTCIFLQKSYSDDLWIMTSKPGTNGWKNTNPQLISYAQKLKIAKIKIRQYGRFKKKLRPDWMKSHIQMVPFI